MTKDTKVGSEDESVVSRLMTGLSGAGRLWRERVKPTLDSVNERMRSAHDLVKSFSDDGQTLKEQWQALQERVQLGASDAISGVRGIYQVSWDALSGLHPKVALALIQLHKVEAMATTRRDAERAASSGTTTSQIAANEAMPPVKAATAVTMPVSASDDNTCALS